jgi:hypothetical protein
VILNMPDDATEGTNTILLGHRSFAIAPIRLGRMRKLRRELTLVLRVSTLPDGEMPDDEVIGAYASIVSASLCAADAALVAADVAALIDELSPFTGMADLARATAAIITLSVGDDDSGEASSPPAPTAA